MMQLGTAYPQRAITTGLCPAVPSVKASEFGWRFAAALEKIAAAKQSPSYGSPKEKNNKVFSRVLKGKC